MRAQETVSRRPRDESHARTAQTLRRAKDGDQRPEEAWTDTQPGTDPRLRLHGVAILGSEAGVDVRKPRLSGSPALTLRHVSPLSRSQVCLTETTRCKP